jgi:predicted nucleic acid-binding protein
MECLVDTCVWIDHLRPGTPHRIRLAADEAVNRLESVVCEPVWFELLRQSPKSERAGMEKRLLTLPMLTTPADLWRKATCFGQHCRDAGIHAGFADLIIATICQSHGATLVTFDSHFPLLAKVIGFKAEMLQRPS